MIKKQNMGKKLLISFLASLILFTSTLSLFASSVNAQRTLGGVWYSPNFEEFTGIVFDSNNPDEVFGERYTYAQVVWIIHSLTAIFVPDIILACFAEGASDAGLTSNCLGEIFEGLTPWEFTGSPSEGNNFASTINNITRNNPLSGIGYIRNTISKFNIIPEASAQGFGFSNLSPIRALWTVIRNASYALLIIAFIIMAFMVMFRVKISPQVVITIQSAIPRLIIALILITFSYAIAGLVVDLSFVFLGLIAVLAGGGELSSLTTIELFEVLISAAPMNGMILTMFVAIIAFTFTIGTTWAGALTMVPIGIIVYILGAIITFLIIILIIVLIVRIIVLMLRTLINIILLVGFAPLLILAGIFPGAGGFGAWLRNLAAQVAIFPGIALMFFLTHYLFWGSVAPGDDFIGAIFSSLASFGINPYHILTGVDSVAIGTGAIYFPGFRLGASTIFGFITSFGILFLIPSIGNIIQSAIAGRPFAFGTAIGQTISGGPLGTIWSGASRGAQQKISTEAGTIISGIGDRIRAGGRGRPTTTGTGGGQRSTGRTKNGL